MATWPCFTAIGRSWGEEWPVSLGHEVMYNWFRYALFTPQKLNRWFLYFLSGHWKFVPGEKCIITDYN